jgi:hypothetical protein
VGRGGGGLRERGHRILTILVENVACIVSEAIRTRDLRKLIRAVEREALIECEY